MFQLKKNENKTQKKPDYQKVNYSILNYDFIRI